MNYVAYTTFDCSSPWEYYKILGIDKNAGAEKIKKAYRNKALELHPDKNHDNEEEAKRQFQKLHTAYETLGDPLKRRIYDAVGGMDVGKPKNAKETSYISYTKLSLLFYLAWLATPFINMDTIDSKKNVTMQLLDKLAKVTELEDELEDELEFDPVKLFSPLKWAYSLFKLAYSLTGIGLLLGCAVVISPSAGLFYACLKRMTNPERNQNLIPTVLAYLGIVPSILILAGSLIASAALLSIFTVTSYILDDIVKHITSPVDSMISALGLIKNSLTKTTSGKILLGAGILSVALITGFIAVSLFTGGAFLPASLLFIKPAMATIAGLTQGISFPFLSIKASALIANACATLISAGGAILASSVVVNTTLSIKNACYGTVNFIKNVINDGEYSGKESSPDTPEEGRAFTEDNSQKSSPGSSPRSTHAKFQQKTGSGVKDSQGRNRSDSASSIMDHRKSIDHRERMMKAGISMLKKRGVKLTDRYEEALNKVDEPMYLAIGIVRLHREKLDTEDNIRDLLNPKHRFLTTREGQNTVWDRLPLEEGFVTQEIYDDLIRHSADQDPKASLEAYVDIYVNRLKETNTFINNTVKRGMK